MFKAGFVQVIPVVAVAALVVLTVSGFSISSEKAQKEAVGKVLSSSDDSSGFSGSGSDSAGSGSDNKGSDSSGRDKPSSAGDSSGSGPARETRIETKTGEGRTKIKTSPQKTKIEVRNEQGRFETKVEEGREETKIRTGNLRIEIKREGDQVVTRIKNEEDEEVELEDDDEDELFREIEDELEEDGIRLATESAQPGFVQDGRRVRTNFPLSVNAETGELIVSTPAGDKVVAVLPDVAIANMISAGVLTRVIFEQPPAEESTSSAAEAGAIELISVDDHPVYLITGVKSQEFLGLIPVNIRVKTVVSASDGQLLDVEQGILARALDLLSF